MTDRRLFFALWPGDRERDQLRDALDPLVRQVDGTAVPRSNWHVTLVFIGAFPAERTGDLAAAAGAIDVEPFRLRFDRFTFWQRPRIGCLEAVTVPPAAETLVSALTAVVRRFGIDVEDRGYRPHVTVVRKARPFDPIHLARPLELTFRGFELVESVPSRGGVSYRPLKQELPRLSS